MAAPDNSELISFLRGLAQQPRVAGGQQYGLGVATVSQFGEAEQQLPPMNVCMDVSATEAATNTLLMPVSHLYKISIAFKVKMLTYLKPRLKQTFRLTTQHQQRDEDMIIGQTIILQCRTMCRSTLEPGPVAAVQILFLLQSVAGGCA